MTHTSISFVIPMYNESKGIENTISKLTDIAKELTSDYEIIVSDDASTDESVKIVEEIAKKDNHIKLTRLLENSKFGGALRKGISLASKDIILYTDSDLPIDRHDIKSALAFLDHADIVTAYSTVKKGENLKRKIISKVYNFLIEFLFGTKIKDINSGFKIYKREIFDGVELISNSPFIDVEIFIRALKKNAIVKQYPIVFKHRAAGVSYIARPAVVVATMMDMLRFKCLKDS